MKSRVAFALLGVAAACLGAGCFKQKTLLVVNPDGSGNIVVSQLVSPQAAGMIGGMADSFGAALGGEARPDAAAAAKDPFFDEAKLTKEAANFGEGVTYVKGRKANENGWQGSVAVYSFSDISKVKLPMDGGQNMSPPGMEVETDAPAKSKKAVTFALAGGPEKTLTITVPQDEGAKKKPARAAQNAGGPDMTAMMMPMLQGMEMSVAVQVKGEVTGSTALNRESDGRVVLLEMNFDKMQASPKFKELMAGAQGGDAEPPKELLLGMPGVKVETNNVVEIRFK